MNEKTIIDAIVGIAQNYASPYKVYRGGVLAVDSISITKQTDSTTPDFSKNIQGTMYLSVTGKATNPEGMLNTMMTIFAVLNSLRSTTSWDPLPSGVLAINQRNAPELVGHDETANNCWLIAGSLEVVYGKSVSDFSPS